MAAKILDAFAQTDASLRLDRVLGKVEAFGNFFLREPIDFPQSDNLAATGRQRFDGVDQMLEILGFGDRIRDGRAFVDDARDIDFLATRWQLMPLVAEMVEGKISRRDEKECPRAGNRAGLPRVQQPRIGFLHDIINVR